MENATTLGDLSDDGIVITDKGSKVLFANRTVLRWSGLTVGDITGIPYNLVFQQSPFSCNENCVHKKIHDSGKAQKVVIRHKTPDGDPKTFELNATPLFDDKGDIAQVVHVIKDRTHEIRDRESCLDHKLLLNLILDVFSGGLVVIDREMRVVLANAEYLKQENLGIHRVSGKPCYVSFRYSTGVPCYDIGKDCPPRESFASGSPAEGMHTVKDSQGKEHYIALKSYPVKDESGVVTHVIEVIQDLTEKAEHRINEKLKIVKLKEEIELLKEEIQKMRGSKDLFTLTLSQQLLP